jgi:glutamate-1-semialdehyde 2,1-aminomutase
MLDRVARSIANSEAAFLKARQYMPGGVSSPVRAFKAVGGTPIFIKEGRGCMLTDIDGNKYIDYVASYGPLIAGHANDEVVAALAKAVGRGTSFGAPTEVETQLAALIVGALPSVEMVRFVSSGTEATMSALRLARAATGRELVVKVAGGYHGHADSFLVQAGSGMLTLAQSEAREANLQNPQAPIENRSAPSSPGIPAAVAASTLLVPYNDLAATRALFERYPEQIACFIVEPVPGNMGVILPGEGYLQGLRDLCTQHGTLLLFDEVMTGFRLDWGGAQNLYKIKPDLTCLGKVIGGGLPVGAYGGSRELMERMSPAGPVYQAGTLSGNPIAMAAGLATLQILHTAPADEQQPAPYAQLEALSDKLAAGLAQAAEGAGVPLTVNRVGSMLTPFFTREAKQPVTNYEQAAGCDTGRYATFFHAMLDEGVYLPPSQFEAWFVTLAHDDEAIAQTLRAADKAFGAVAGALRT